MLKKYTVDALVNVAYFVQRICGQLDTLLTLETQVTHMMSNLILWLLTFL